jgi:15-cis-phytoene synthase
VNAPAAATLVPREIAARSGSSFLLGFRCLPRQRREAMTSIYAFCRVVDDAVDDARDARQAAEHLAFWRQELEAAAGGEPRTAVGRGLQQAMQCFGLRAAPLREVLDGVASDLQAPDYEDLAALQGYCHLVAAAVGLACLPVLGVHGEGAETFAEQLGQALQLTNILRDLRSDAAAGRVYVPRSWLRELDVDPAWLAGGGPAAAYATGGAVARLCSKLAEVATTHFAAARAALRALPAADRRRLVPARIMAAIYFDLLGRLRRRGGELRGRRVRVSKVRKLWLAAVVAAGIRQ